MGNTNCAVLFLSADICKLAHRVFTFEPNIRYMREGSLVGKVHRLWISVMVYATHTLELFTHPGNYAWLVPMIRVICRIH